LVSRFSSALSLWDRWPCTWCDSSSGVGSWYSRSSPEVPPKAARSLQTEQTVLPAAAEAGDMPTYLEVDAYGNETMRVILPDGRTATLVVDDLTSAALIE
jgi:hypothetical protein